MAQDKNSDINKVTHLKEGNSKSGSTRRKFLFQLATVAVAAQTVPTLGFSLNKDTDSRKSSNKSSKKPNIILYHSDEFRWDFVCAAGQNSMAFTPNLDSMYRRGTVFQNFISNQPLCSPSRSCLFTGQYATTTGVWKNGPGLKEDAVTLATQFTQSGYSANYIGKWHLAPWDKVGAGAVPKEYRSGFTGLWQASNAPEISSHPYHGTFWDNDGKPLEYNGQYRVDFLTDLAEKFLQQKHDKPFFLVISQLEPHQQNDLLGFAPPKGYGERFNNPYIPPDLKLLPGDWQYQISNYYGDIKAIDDSLGRILKTLKEQNLEENTIIIFTSDHGCHFRTRNNEYKRSPHESSIHVPLMIQGPGFDNRITVPELVNMVDLAPSILDSVGLAVPSTMQGQSFIPLMHDADARASWRNESFIQISESETARALRTPEWTYVALSPDSNPAEDSGSLHYRDYQLYNNRADPAQLVNLAGRSDVIMPSTKIIHYIGERSMEKITEELRNRLIERMVEAGEERPKIDYWPYYP
ncbi:MAG: sulfatase-like hydrolase/transferase [Ignavibacteriaceae bacterium]